jgi:hypothetical protein
VTKEQFVDTHKLAPRGAPSFATEQNDLTCSQTFTSLIHLSNSQSRILQSLIHSLPHLLNLYLRLCIYQRTRIEFTSGFSGGLEKSVSTTSSRGIFTTSSIIIIFNCRSEQRDIGSYETEFFEFDNLITRTASRLCFDQKLETANCHVEGKTHNHGFFQRYIPDTPELPLCVHGDEATLVSAH